VGAGDIVRAVHLPALKVLPDVRVEWLCDIDAGQAATMATAYGVPSTPFVEDPRELPEADVVLLATPYGVRRPYYEALRERGTAVYVEKPVACSGEWHRELCSWFPDHALASGLMMRVWGPSRVAREAVQSGLFGRLRRARFGFGKPGLVTQGRFYFDKEMGGAGMMFEVGIHGIDTLLRLSGATGFEVREVHGVRDANGLDLHTRGCAWLTSGDGGVVDCEIVVTALEESIEGVELELDNAVLRFPLVGQGYALVGEQVDWNVQVQPRQGGRGYRLEPTTGLTPITKFQMFVEYWKLFLEGVRTGVANETSAADSLLTTELIESFERTVAKELAA
jgi:predicted dehydrogenase